MEFENQEEEEMTLGGPAYDESLGNSHSTRSSSKMVPEPVVAAARISLGNNNKSKYKECLKNHAVGIGGHAVDGCGEFIPAGEDGTLESLKCAACNCHRNFHWKEPDGFSSTAAFGFHQYGQFGYRGPPPMSGYGLHVAPQQQRPPLLALPSTSGGSELEDYYNAGNMYNPGNGIGKKRVRTKFTADQKGKMTNLAGRLGWRIQKQDEEIVQEFCNEVGIKRHVLKVWMHNNKHTLGASGKKP